MTPKPEETMTFEDRLEKADNSFKINFLLTSDMINHLRSGAYLAHKETISEVLRFLRSEEAFDVQNEGDSEYGPDGNNQLADWLEKKMNEAKK